MNCLSLDRFPPLVEGPMEKELAQSEKAFDDVTEELASVTEELETVRAQLAGWTAGLDVPSTSYTYRGTALTASLVSCRLEMPLLTTLNVTGSNHILSNAFSGTALQSVSQLRTINLDSTYSGAYAINKSAFNALLSQQPSNTVTLNCAFSSTSPCLANISEWFSPYSSTDLASINFDVPFNPNSGY